MRQLVEPRGVERERKVLLRARLLLPSGHARKRGRHGQAAHARRHDGSDAVFAAQALQLIGLVALGQIGQRHAQDGGDDLELGKVQPRLILLHALLDLASGQLLCLQMLAIGLAGGKALFTRMRQAHVGGQCLFGLRLDDPALSIHRMTQHLRKALVIAVGTAVFRLAAQDQGDDAAALALLLEVAQFLLHIHRARRAGRRQEHQKIRAIQRLGERSAEVGVGRQLLLVLEHRVDLRGNRLPVRIGLADQFGGDLVGLQAVVQPVGPFAALRAVVGVAVADEGAVALGFGLVLWGSVDFRRLLGGHMGGEFYGDPVSLIGCIWLRAQIVCRRVRQESPRGATLYRHTRVARPFSGFT
ncbi:hypothetical protein SDC9_121947 [bioreactor metagenome]|uniref:Uncharacterized protein n=1 Tax=bioreactor metagenome TaxID=1076179 RepID=A0A645CDI2_9ZZZZ